MAHLRIPALDTIVSAHAMLCSNNITERFDDRTALDQLTLIEATWQLLGACSVFCPSLEVLRLAYCRITGVGALHIAQSNLVLTEFVCGRSRQGIDSNDPKGPGLELSTLKSNHQF